MKVLPVMTNKAVKLNSLALVAFGALALVFPVRVYADCEQNYGGGETCVFSKRFKIEKEVRIAGDSEWEDKVTGVEKNDTVEFKIIVENTGDVTTDNMEMKDYLPDELVKLVGNLTEEWENFDNGEDNAKTFIVKVKVDEKEFARENFEKCVVNKAVVKFDDDEEASDTATVCYGDLELTELPKTGPETAIFLTIAGIALIGAGIVFKTKARVK